MLGFACSLALITYLDRISMMRVQGDISARPGSVADVQMGWVFNAFTLGYLLFEVPVGWMGDVWGSRRVLTRIVLCWSVFTALTGAIWSFSPERWAELLILNAFVTMLLMRFLFGCGEAGAFPILARVVGNWFPYQERGMAQGIIWTSARIGGALSPLVIGRLAVWLGWRQAFWVLGAVGLVWCFFFYRWFRSTPEEKPECNDAERELDPIRAVFFQERASRGRSCDAAMAQAPDQHEPAGDLHHVGRSQLRLVFLRDLADQVLARPVRTGGQLPGNPQRVALCFRGRPGRWSAANCRTGWYPCSAGAGAAA